MGNFLRVKRTFIARQIAPVTLVALLSCLSDYAASILSTIIVGGNFSEIGLVIVGVATPIETFRLFICDFFCGSAVYLRNVSIAEGNKDKGARMIGSTLLIVSAIGLILFFGMYFGAEIYLSFFGLCEETIAMAVPYVKAMALNPLVGILMYYSYEFVFRLGTKVSAMLMVLTSSVGIGLIALVLVPLMGISGMAYSCVLANGITVVIGVITMLKHKDEFSFKFKIRRDEFIELVRYGFSYSQDTFYYPVYSAAINMFLGRSMGESAIAVFAIIECVSEICSIFYGVSYALGNQLGYYVGEKNTDGIRKSLAAALRLQFIIAVIATLAVFIFAKPIAVYMGMEDAYAAETIFALRLYSLSFVFLAWVCFNLDFYCANEQTVACVSLYFSKTIIVGIGITIALGSVFGSTGVYLGKALEAPLALLITYFVTRKAYNSKSIYILPEDDGSIVSYDYDLNPDEIMETHTKLGELLESRGIPKDTIMRLLLAFEECNMLTAETNKPGVYGECTVFFRPDAVEMILRDSGRLYDVSDINNSPASLREYVVGNMVTHYQNTSHINASNTNRVALRFPVSNKN